MQGNLRYFIVGECLHFHIVANDKPNRDSSPQIKKRIGLTKRIKKQERKGGK